jgi:hypothetical protein
MFESAGGEAGASPLVLWAVGQMAEVAPWVGSGPAITTAVAFCPLVCSFVAPIWLVSYAEGATVRCDGDHLSACRCQ